MGLSSAQLRVVLTYSGESGYLIDEPAHWLVESSTPTTTTFLVPVSGGAATGTATATFAFGTESGESGTLTAAISATSGEPIAGRVTATLTKTFIDVGTYSCTAT